MILKQAFQIKHVIKLKTGWQDEQISSLSEVLFILHGEQFDTFSPDLLLPGTALDLSSAQVATFGLRTAPDSKISGWKGIKLHPAQYTPK
ncbi:MAG: hypothetical protein ACI9S8_001249 [Chlamydiales bacterium]